MNARLRWAGVHKKLDKTVTDSFHSVFIRHFSVISVSSILFNSRQKLPNVPSTFCPFSVPNVDQLFHYLIRQHPSCSTLQCDTLLWDDMPWNSPKRPPYWNSTSGFDFYHYRSRHVILHQSAKFYLNRITLSKMTSCRFSRWRISTILDFRDLIMGALKSPITAY